MTDLLLRHGEWDVVDPASASWRYLSFRVDRLRDDEHVSRNTGERGGGPRAAGWQLHRPQRRNDVGARRARQRLRRHAVVPCTFRATRSTCSQPVGDVEVAVCGALADEQFEPRLVSPEDVEIEVRGSGNATRQINHIIKPEFPAQRLLVVEVFTPAGNWSSYPPHKHDEDHPPGEVVLEEVYYYRTQSEPPGAFAVQRLYSPQHGTDLTETVRDGDIMLVPHGYHTTAAAHGYDLYYLNGLAGDRRSMASADDPSLAWIRPAWEKLERDPRVPLVTLEGRRN